MKTDGTIERIVAGVDGSSGSMRALEWAINVARGTGAEIIAVHAWRPSLASTTLSADGREARRQAGVMFEYSWCAPLTQAQVAHRMVFAEGHPVSQLIKTAVDQQADLIAVGARGQGGFSELLLGSVSQQLTAHAPLPVVVVPLPAALSRQETNAYKSAARRLSFSEIS